MTWIKRLLLACRRLALQPLHCRNILDRIRQNNLYVDPKGRFGVSFSCCFIMQKHAQLDAFFPPQTVFKLDSTRNPFSVSQNLCFDFLNVAHRRIYALIYATLSSDTRALLCAGAATAGSCNLCQAGAYQTGSGQPLSS